MSILMEVAGGQDLKHLGVNIRDFTCPDKK